MVASWEFKNFGVVTYKRLPRCAIYPQPDYPQTAMDRLSEFLIVVPSDGGKLAAS
jgi:hypothetical protein